MIGGSGPTKMQSIERNVQPIGLSPARMIYWQIFLGRIRDFRHDGTMSLKPEVNFNFGWFDRHIAGR
ncbi:unnamed protein product [Zymoseptoria tritici ST99CH_1E4]|uniref:Uncharacterized protein n=1 Tax=Zymoseptoria tritici ST99CH_1E4 TaxID=1276532 RepID=A0A2H1H925_ZYMTR|nr:unnamed protein product [Zymoseptoria tritici ST99CH_1E4]